MNGEKWWWWWGRGVGFRDFLGGVAVRVLTVKKEEEEVGGCE